ncbi:prephenate dehydratase [Qipengyuania sediminis]|uniref:prephenate dehydratase n=1 Tax=Qipengyuania sediminis TaxID=1532023 RepID=UPI0010597586|nr:prephenate dehydratase [Qipengyuania sediminis]
MRKFPEPALALVDAYRAAAAAAPARAIAFAGAPGCNSHRAAEAFDPHAPVLPCYGFEDALDAVHSGAAGMAMIPIDNSEAGRVADIHTLLPDSGLHIVAEQFLPITHALMGLAPGPFEGAWSHPHALAQSRRFLQRRGIAGLSYADTAGAAALVKERGDPSMAAIAPPLAAELYGLTIVEEAVEDAPDNTTRFVVVTRMPKDPAALAGVPAMTSFVFEVRNVPAALYKALGCFATNGVNMTKLESYQQGASFAATRFYCDIEGAPGEPQVDAALEELAYQASDLRLLGSYARARKRG